MVSYKYDQCVSSNLVVNLNNKEFRYIDPLYTNTINTNIYIIDYFVSLGKYHLTSFQNIHGKYVATD